MKYIVHIPLAGGFAIGNMNIIGHAPLAITTYSAFLANDSLYTRYVAKRGYEIPYYQLDKLSEEEILAMLESFGEIDFVSAVPPCSGLSQAASRKKGSRSTAPPNEWMYESAHFVLGRVKPTLYAFENAPGLYSNVGIEVRDNLIALAKQYGYAITFYKTNTIKHGVPQFRPRTFCIFYKGKYAPILHSYNRPVKNIIEYLKEIPEDALYQNDYIHPEFDVTKFNVIRFMMTKLGDNWREKVHEERAHIATYDYLIKKGWLDEFQTWQAALPDEERDKTVTKDIAHIKKKLAMDMGFRINHQVLGMDQDYVYAVIGELMGRQLHPTEDRLMNIREFMHLMGLPHDYEVVNPADYVKITQNIPVCTTEDLTREIVSIIKGERMFSDQSVLMQDNTKPIETHKAVKLF